jgi:hypothetical protein
MSFVQRIAEPTKSGRFAKSPWARLLKEFQAGGTMRAKLILMVVAAAVVAFVSQASAQNELIPLGGAGAAPVSASEPLAALAVGLGLLGARLLRRR